MTTDDLSRLHQARPFKPFNIRLGGGEALPVARQEMLTYAPKGPTAFLYFEEGSFEIIDLSLVTGLEVPTRKRGGGIRN